MLIKHSNSLEVLATLDASEGVLFFSVLISSIAIWEAFIAFDTMKLMSLRSLIDDWERDDADLAPADMAGEYVAG